MLEIPLHERTKVHHSASCSAFLPTNKFGGFCGGFGDVTQKTLENGLTVILKEVHHAPVISWWVLYRIGSRNEPTGKTGISHWVEHMLFKGTDQFPAGVLDKAIDRAGGQWNAFTSMDFTMYYETLPSDRIDIALEAEADRMVNARFDHEETESKRTVIISERHGAENRPLFWLGEEIRATAFRVHGYHHEIIGDLSDIETMTRDDLYNHYQRHYTPSNAVVVGVGDFETGSFLEKVEEIYGKIPNGVPPPRLFSRPEPAQNGERRTIVHRPGNTAFLEIAYHIPNGTHEDWFKLSILNSILTGSGGASDNKTSRLYQALVKTELAASISGGMTASIDPYLYSFIATVRDGHTPQEVEDKLFKVITQIQQDGVTDEELNRAQKQARAIFAYSTERITQQAYWLARSAGLGDVNWFDDYAKRLQEVTRDDVQAVAQRYLHDKNRVVGHLIPIVEGGNK